MASSVHDILSASAEAASTAGMALGGGRAATIWTNRNDRVAYDAPKGHTFSLYLAGGTGTRRLDKGGIAGHPGAICIIPEGQKSEWEISSVFRFVHLYLPDDDLRAAWSRIHDRDARLVGPPDLTFQPLPAIAAGLGHLARAIEDADPLAADAATSELIAGLPGSRPLRIAGGLAPRVLARIDDWIDAHLDQTIRLSDLAAQADLSEFHVHRMFRVSRGTSPQAWIMARRIDRAKALLKTGRSLADIALDCGFAHQSHFNRVFRKATAMPPGAWRRLSQSGASGAPTD